MTYKASYIHYLKDAYDYYRITLEDGSRFRILRLGMNQEVWIQDIKYGGDTNTCTI
jgi:hypothetical protein